MGNTILGVLIMLVATSMTNVGAVLQKKAVEGLPPFDRRPLLESVRAVLRTPLWLGGWLMTTAAIVANMVALGLADISVIQPLNGFGLVVLALFSRAYLGERLTRGTLVGIGLVIAGVVIVGVSAPPSRAFATSSELLDSYTHTGALFALTALVGVAGVSWGLARRFAALAGVLYAFAAATCSVLGLTLSKGFFGLLTLLGPGPALRLPPSWALLALVVLFANAALVLQQLSFQKGRAVVVTPVFAAASVVLPLLTGRFVFGERLQGAVWLAPALIVAGVILLGLRAQSDPKQSALPAAAKE